MTEKRGDIILAEDAQQAEAWSIPQIDGDGNIIRAEPKPSEEEIIEDVEEATYKPLTASELEEIRRDAEQEGRDKGYQQGLAKGHQEGYQAGFDEASQKVSKEGQETLQQQVTQLLSIAEELIEPITHQQEQLETMLVDFVCSLTEQVIAREVKMDRGDLVGTVNTALNALPTGAESIILWLHPDDIKVIEEFRESKAANWQLKAAPELLPGGCRIESSQSLVDHTIESRIERLLEQFRHRQLADHDPAPDIASPEGEPPQDLADKDDLD